MSETVERTVNADDEEQLDLTHATATTPAAPVVGAVAVAEEEGEEGEEGEEEEEEDDGIDAADDGGGAHMLMRSGLAQSAMARSSMGLGATQRVSMTWRDIEYRVPSLSNKLLQSEARAWAASTGAGAAEFFRGYDTASVDVAAYRRALCAGEVPPRADVPPLPSDPKELSAQLSRFKSEKRVLSSMSGHAAPGTLTCVMGASGSGKTSLVDVLAGRKRATAGTVAFNGAQIKSLSRWHRLVAYVPQADILVPAMTVRETLYFYADLKLDRSKLSQRERHEKADELIRDLHLDKAASTPIGDDLIKGVSGGEKKRVSIAVQLLTNPSVIVLDEPTSGLDSSTAYSLIGILSHMAHAQQRTVICTIHQPSSQMFAAFDRLILLVDGQLAYQGRVAKVVSYLRDVGCPCPSYTNPADRMIDLVTGYGAGSASADADDAKKKQADAADVSTAAAAAAAADDDDKTKKHALELHRFEVTRERLPEWDKNASSTGGGVIKETVIDLGASSPGETVVDMTKVKQSVVDMSAMPEATAATATSKKTKKKQKRVDKIGLERSKDAIDLVSNVAQLRRYLVAYYLQSEMAASVEKFVLARGGGGGGGGGGDSDGKQKTAPASTTTTPVLAGSGSDSLLSGELDGVVADGPRTSFAQQYLLLYRRNWLRMRRDPLLIKIRFAQVAMTALLMGIIFLRLDWSQSGALSRLGFCGFLMISTFFTTVFNMVQTFPTERNVFIRDRSSQMYDILPYYLAIITADLPFQLGFPTFAATVSYWMVGVNDNGERFAQFLVITVLAANVAAALGLAIGAGVPSVQVGSALAPMIVVMFVMFSGVFVTTDQIPNWLEWLIYISPIKYGVAALQWIALHDMPIVCDTPTPASGEPTPAPTPTMQPSPAPTPNYDCDTNNGNSFLRIYDTEDTVWWQNALVLLGMYVLLRVLGFVVLYLYDRSELNPIACDCLPCCRPKVSSTDDDDNNNNN